MLTLIVRGRVKMKVFLRLAKFAEVILLILALLVVAGSSLAQTTTRGAIGGTVYDSSGAAVPKAKVVAHDNGTNAEQETVTDDSGYYRLATLQPAVYTVTITAEGFAEYKADHVVVQVGTITELSPRLNIASFGRTVVVTAEAPMVNTSYPDFAPIVNQTAISNLPINGGRWSDFTLLTPSVVNDSNGFGLVSFRGISTLLNNNTIDGADNNQAFFSEERGRTRIGYSSAKAAIQEFQVNTSNYSAEYGRAAGGVVNTITKSGSNQFHGEAYFYDRNNNWGATNPFTRLTTETSPGVFTSSPYKPTDVRYITGTGIGGPIIKDKLFFFFAFDYYNRDFPGTAVPGSPSAFFATPVPDLTNFGGSCATLNAAAIRALPNGANVLTATQGACTLFTRLALPNYAAGVTDYNNGLNGLIGELGTVPRNGVSYIYFPKIDWNINKHNHLAIEVNRMRWSSPAGIQTQASNTFGVASFGNDYVKDTWVVARLSTYLTQTIANEMRYQYGRDFEYETPQSPTQYELTNFVHSPNFPGYTNPLGLPPDVFITNGFDMGVPTFLTRPAYPDERRQQFSDTMTWNHGNHLVKFGGDYTHANDKAQNLRYQFGSFSYTNIANYLSDFYKPDTCGGKSCYLSYTQAFGPLGFQFNTNDFALFISDDWKVLPRLTLNFGLRYEREVLPSPFLINSAVPQTGHMPADTNNWGPRLGFAWDIFGDGKTSLRGGAGIYYGRVINSTIYNALINTGNLGGQLQFTFNPTSLGAPTFPQIIATPGKLLPPNIVFFPNTFKLPEVTETDLSIERDIGWNTVISASYLGSFGRQLPDFVDTNISPSTANVTYTIVDATGKGPLPNGSTYTTPVFVAPRPNPAYGAMTAIFSGVTSNYNALVIQANHRMSHYIQFNANYTWSHAIDYGQNASTFTDTNDLLLPNTIKPEYGNSIFNVPNRFVVSSVMQSPWHVDGWAGYLANDWQFAPIYQIQNGLAYSLVTSGNVPLPAGFLIPGGGINGSGGRKGIATIGRNSFRLPRTQVFDMRVAKKVVFAEKYTAEFSLDAFNLFNHVNYTAANNTAYFVGGTVAAPTLTFNPPFGTFQSANSNFAYSSRQLQIGLRFLF